MLTTVCELYLTPAQKPASSRVVLRNDWVSSTKNVQVHQRHWAILNKVLSKVNLLLFSRHDPTFSHKNNALIMPQITGPLPTQLLDYHRWSHFNNITLGYKPVDLILDCDILILCLRNADHLPYWGGSPFSFNIAFGYVVFGEMRSRLIPLLWAATLSHNTLMIRFTPRQSNPTMAIFWDTEGVSTLRLPTPDKKRCEQYFLTIHQRDTDDS